MSSTVEISAPAHPAARVPKMFALTVILSVAGVFLFRYALHYYLRYNPASYDVYWPRRFGLLLHITSGTLALLIGPWQFSRRLRQRRLGLHRVMGRVYLIAIVCGALGAVYLAITTTFGWPWGFGLIGLALAWLTTAGMAYYAIRQRQIQVHQEWMVRSYVVTFAFVTFRFLSDTPPFSHMGPPNELAITYIWACWALPLLVTEVIMQVRRMPSRAVRSVG
jgi:uncharacterized membrane protein